MSSYNSSSTVQFDAIQKYVHERTLGCLYVKGHYWGMSTEESHYHKTNGSRFLEMEKNMQLTDNNDVKTPTFSESVEDLSQTRRKQTPTRGPHYWRNMAAFWTFGLTNNIGYITMLSGAYDILAVEDNPSIAPVNFTDFFTSTEVPSDVDEVNSKESEYLKCNPMGTGTILLAVNLPALLIRLIGAPVIQNTPYRLKVFLVVTMEIGGYLIAALTNKIWTKIIGVIFVSLGYGVGEMTFLGLSTFYHIDTISMWSSGAGGAGVLGALIYAGLTTAGISPQNTLLIMSSAPLMTILTYVFVLKATSNDSTVGESLSLLKDKDDYNIKTSVETEFSIKEKLQMIPSFLKYVLPLTVCVSAHGFINQGVQELLYFKDFWLSQDEQYRWYQVIYQITNFISRSTASRCPIRFLWAFPIFQLMNVAILVPHVFFRYIPTIWITLGIVLWEGLISGGLYVNTLLRVTNEVPKELLEYSIALTTLSHPTGVVTAGALAMWFHDAVCSMHIKL